MKELLSSVSPKGQVTIPVEIRERLGVKPKDKVIFTVEDGEVKLRPATATLEASYQAVPALAQPLTFDQMREIARDDATAEAAQEGLDGS
jgi:antitoxin PrlF